MENQITWFNVREPPVFVFEEFIESDVEREWSTSIETSTDVCVGFIDLSGAAVKFEPIHEGPIEYDCRPQCLVINDDIVPIFADEQRVAKL